MDHLKQGTCLIKASHALHGTITVPGDKSISHRSVMLGALAKGTTTVRGFLEGEDCINTLRAFQQMGVNASRQGSDITIEGVGIDGLHEPNEIVDLGNSGTGARLILGVLSGQPFATTLTGDSSLRSRPMARVTVPLSQMGAQFLGRDNNNKFPLTVRGGHIKGIHYQTPVASAQIKSSVLLAGLFADGVTKVTESVKTRDHTERMFQSFGIEMKIDGTSYSLEGGQELTGREIAVPGDISSAAFFMAAACIVPGSNLVIQNVGINPTRTGLLDVLREMGANITMLNESMLGAEPVADIQIQHSALKGVHVSGETVSRMIDEFPILAVLSCFAETPTTVEGAEELRVKESDRIATIVGELTKMGAKITEKPDGFTVEPGVQLMGASCASHGDHRIAMSVAIAALAAVGDTTIQGTAPIKTSFPEFFTLLQQLAPESVTVES